MPNTAGDRNARWPAYVRLRALCKAVGIEGPTQLAVELARQDGDDRAADKISVTQPAAWWDGKQAPSFDKIAAILRLTGGSAGWLMLGEGDMFIVEAGAKEMAFDHIAATIDRIRASGAPQQPALERSGRAFAAAQRRLQGSREQQTSKDPQGRQGRKGTKGPRSAGAG